MPTQQKKNLKICNSLSKSLDKKNELPESDSFFFIYKVFSLLKTLLMSLLESHTEGYDTDIHKIQVG